MDDDLLRGLDWEVERIDESDARELVLEAIRRHREGELEEALDMADRGLLQAKLEPVADDRVRAVLMLLRAVCLGELKRFDEALIVSGQAREFSDSQDDDSRFLGSRSRNLHALLLAERGEREEAVRQLTGLSEELAD